MGFIKKVRTIILNKVMDDMEKEARSMGLLKDLKITVMKDTAEGLEKMAHEGAMTIGEVVDRLVLQLAPSEPEVAEMLLTQEILIILSNLSEEDSQRVYIGLSKAVLMACPEEALYEIVANVRDEKAKALEKLAALPGEDKAELIKALTELS